MLRYFKLSNNSSVIQSITSQYWKNRIKMGTHDPPAVTTHCHHPLSPPTVTTHCHHPLSPPTVTIHTHPPPTHRPTHPPATTNPPIQCHPSTVTTHYLHTLSSPTVTTQCHRPLSPPTVITCPHTLIEHRNMPNSFTRSQMMNFTDSVENLWSCISGSFFSSPYDTMIQRDTVH